MRFGRAVDMLRGHLMNARAARYLGSFLHEVRRIMKGASRVGDTTLLRTALSSLRRCISTAVTGATKHVHISIHPTPPHTGSPHSWHGRGVRCVQYGSVRCAAVRGARCQRVSENCNFGVVQGPFVCSRQLQPALAAPRTSATAASAAAASAAAATSKAPATKRRAM